MNELLDRIHDIRTTVRPRASYTLEPATGETYRHAKPVLYALSKLRKKDRTFKYDDFGEGGGTSYIPSSVLTRHLPDDEG